MSRFRVWGVASLLAVAALGPACNCGNEPGFGETPDGGKQIDPDDPQYAGGNGQRPPVGISRIEPARGPTTGGTVLVVRGYNFTPTVRVTIGGADATDVTVTDAQTLSLVTPAGTEGAADVILENSDGAKATFAGGFTFVTLVDDAPPAPRLNAVLPNSGPTTGGTVATLEGESFQRGAIVVVGGRPARSVTFVSEGVLTAIFPEGPAGTAKVAVTNPDGRSDLRVGAFAYYEPTGAAAPQLSALAPADGPVSGGAAVRATGERFDPAVRAFLGGIPVMLESNTGTELAFTTPPGRRGLAAFSVTNPDGQSATLTDGYNYFSPPPVLLGVSPAWGPEEGGTTITITGRYFATGATVTVGGQPLTNVVVTDISISGLTPAAANAGPADVTVVNPDGLGTTLAGGFFYANETTPPPLAATFSITRLQPPTGPSTGGTTVTLFGNGFEAGDTVTVGGTAAPEAPRVLGTTTLIFRLPPGNVGPQDVVVRHSNGTAALKENAFIYFDASSPLASPMVQSVLPRVSRTAGGGRVAVYGSGFAEGARVLFGSNAATGVRVASASSISALVPPGSAGAVDVVVVNPDGRSGTLADGFAYFAGQSDAAPPTVMGISPAMGSTVEPTQVTITGTGFTEGTVLFVDGVPVPVTVVSDTQLDAEFPPHGAGNVDVTVTNPDGQSFTTELGFTYVPPAPPVVTRLNPARGSTAEPTVVGVEGSGFTPGTIVKVDGAAVMVTYVSANLLTAEFPAHTAGNVTVVVENVDGQTVTVTGGFTYEPPAPPTVTAVAPTRALTTATTQVRVIGSGFTARSTVVVDGADVQTSLVSATELSATFPPHAAAVVDVTVRNADGQTATLTGAFTYELAPGPAITLINPTRGPASATTTVTVTGSNFSDGARILLDGTELPTTRASATELRADFPPHIGGPVDVTVQNVDGQTVTVDDGFTYMAPPPTVTAVSPALAPVSGNVAVLVSGTGFVLGAQVFFGGAAAASTVLDPTNIRAVAPAGNPGTVDVVVQNPDGQTATLAAAFEYRPGYSPGAAPSITDLYPATGPTTGGTRAVLRGTEFADGMRVEVGGRSAQVVVISSTVATITTPVGEEGPQDVVVVNADGQYAARLRAFTYVDPASYPTAAPRVTGATPNHGPESRRTPLYVTGGGFVSGAIFFIRDRLAENILFSHAGLLRGDAPPQLSGGADVTVTNPDGRSVTLSNGFFYDESPSVSAVSPDNGPTAGGTSVLISGNGFRSGAAVYFGASQSPSVRVLSGTVLEAVTPPGSKGVVTVRVVDTDGQESTLVDGFTFVPPPSITGLSPATGPSTGGTVLVLTGAEFLPGVTVTIGGRPAVVERADDTTLVVTTPTGTNGNADVVVVNPDGQRSANGSGTFTFLDPATLGPAPTLTTVNPARGPLGGGTLSAFFGTNFQPGTVFIVGSRAVGNVLRVNATRATGTIGAGASLGSVRAVATNPDGQSAMLANAFTYLDPATLPPAPQIFQVVPNQGSTFGGDTALVEGQAFTAGSVVFIGGIPQPTNVNGPNALAIVAEAGPLGLQPVTVTTGEGLSVTLQDAWEYILPPPQIISVNPTSGIAAGGTTITLQGRNFLEGAVVKVNGNNATGVTVVSPFEVTAVTPSGPDGPAAVEVVNPNTLSATLPNGFTYVAAPVLSAMSPTSGPISGGTNVTITGAFFRPGVTVTLGGNPLSNLNRVSDTVITGTTPAGASGPARLVITNSDGQLMDRPGAFTYLVPVPPPAVGSVSPNYGPVSGGTVVAITGTGFQVGADVTFDGTSATDVVVISPTSLTARVPGGTGAGTVDVAVVNPDDQTATRADAFTYVAEQQFPPLVLLAITPNTGNVSGGTRIVLSGRGIKNGAQVSVDGVAATNVQWLGPTAIAADTPPHVGGQVDVSVTNPGSPPESYTMVNGFRYNAGGRYVSAAQFLAVESAGGKRGALLFDYDRDGDSDYLLHGTTTVVIGTTTHHRPRLFRNDAGVFVEVTNTNMAVSLPSDDRYDVVPGDFDGDGDLDLFVVGNSQKQVLRNDAGTFVYAGVNNQTSWTSPSGARSAAVGDINGDGLLDVVVGYWDQQEERYLNNPGNPGTFTRSAFGLNDRTTAIVLGDVDADGDLDCFTANHADQQKQLYLNDGNGAFTITPAGAQFPVTAGNSTTAVMRDLDGDNDLDIVLGNDGQQDRVFLNNGFGVFTDSTTGRMPSDTDRTQNLHLLDLDNDGDLDLVGVRYDANRMRIYLNSSNSGPFAFYDVSSSNTPSSLGEHTLGVARVRWPDPHTVSVVQERLAYDVTNDTYADLIQVNQAAQNRLLANLGSGSASVFQYRTQTALPEENDRTATVKPADLDGDGDLDMVKAVAPTITCIGSCTTDDGKLRLLFNDGAGNFTDLSAGRMPATPLAASEVLVFDVDNDNDRDLMVVQGHARSPMVNAVYLFLNDGMGNFTDVSTSRLPSGNRVINGAYAASTIDFNLDGRMDVVIGQSANVRLWQNIGPGYFMDVTPGSNLDNVGGGVCGSAGYPATANLGVHGIGVGDLNGDTWPDLVLARSGCFTPAALNAVLFNQAGSGVFVDETSSHLPSTGRAITVSLFDADGDTDLDVYFVNSTDDRLYLNTGGGFLSDVTVSHMPTRVDATCAVGIVDVDEDGLRDIFLGKNDSCVSDSFDGNARGRQNRLLVNVGVGHYEDYTDEKLPNSDDNTSSVITGDFDQDGKLDIYLNNMGQSRLYLWRP